MRTANVEAVLAAFDRAGVYFDGPGGVCRRLAPTTEDGGGWVEIMNGGALLQIYGKTGWREVEIGRGSHPATRVSLPH